MVHVTESTAPTSCSCILCSFFLVQPLLLVDTEEMNMIHEFIADSKA